MGGFKEFLNEYAELNEVAIQVGGRTESQFGQVVILAGGAASGKGFVKDNLLDVQGKTFDVDALKSLALKSKLIQKRIKQEYDRNLEDMNLGNPEDVKLLHALMVDIGLEKRGKDAVASSILAAHPERKPNLIFDVTLRQMKKVVTITDFVKELGYKKENVHIVWVLNKIDVALFQNKKRARRVPDDILKDVHSHVSLVMRDVLTGVFQLRKYMDGMFIVVPNQANVDTKVKASSHGGHYFAKADYYILKKKNHPFRKFQDIDNELMRKIRKYVPNPEIWIDKEGD
jgi:hypothetical protein